MLDDRRRHWEERHRTDSSIDRPSPFVVQALRRLDVPSAGSGGHRALDLACGRGRHALLLAQSGYEVDAVDYALPALTTLQEAARNCGLRVRCFAADLTAWPLPRAHYALVVVVNFLDRTLFPSLRAAVAPGGALLYETHHRDDTPSPGHILRPDFLLAPGELEQLCRDWRVLARHEDATEHRGRRMTRAGILAQRPVDAHPAGRAH